MSSSLRLDDKVAKGILVDTNLFVLLVVGAVNIRRIQHFKPTQRYTERDYELLLSEIGRYQNRVYTVAHVMAEVTDLIDLPGSERKRAREVLKEFLGFMTEPALHSRVAAEDLNYERLGLVDAAILTIAREHGCMVLTDDFDLYVTLSRREMPVLNFTHLRARESGI